VGGEGEMGESAGSRENGRSDKIRADFHGDLMGFAHTGRVQSAAELDRKMKKMACIQKTCVRRDGGGRGLTMRSRMGMLR
jgi:hypothetical protein